MKYIIPYLINLIESGQPSDLIRKQAQELVYKLHGNAQLETMPPGGAALYLCALIVREL